MKPFVFWPRLGSSNKKRPSIRGQDGRSRGTHPPAPSSSCRLLPGLAVAVLGHVAPLVGSGHSLSPLALQVQEC